MTSTLSAIFERMAKVLRFPTADATCVQHGDLAHQFALVAPLGGGAVIALQQALRLPESDHGSLLGTRPRRGRPSWGWAVSPQP